MAPEVSEAALDDRLPPALLVLTGVTGLVDAVSFLGLGHIFTANMTGNVVFLGFAAAGVPGLSVARSSTSLVAFLAGAAPAVASALPWPASVGAVGSSHSHPPLLQGGSPPMAPAWRGD